MTSVAVDIVVAALEPIVAVVVPVVYEANISVASAEGCSVTNYGDIVA